MKICVTKIYNNIKILITRNANLFLFLSQLNSFFILNFVVKDFYSLISYTAYK